MKLISLLVTIAVVTAGLTVYFHTNFVTAGDLKRNEEQTVKTFQSFQKQQVLKEKLTKQELLENYRDDLTFRIKIARERNECTIELEQKLHDVQTRLDKLIIEIE